MSPLAIALCLLAAAYVLMVAVSMAVGVFLARDERLEAELDRKFSGREE